MLCNVYHFLPQPQLLKKSATKLGINHPVQPTQTPRTHTVNTPFFNTNRTSHIPTNTVFSTKSSAFPTTKKHFNQLN